MIEPIKLCELEAGRPRYQVPRFQTMAEINRANTMANPAPEPTLMTSSTGSRLMTPKATAPEEVSTPARLHNARPNHGDPRRQAVGVNDRGHGVGGVVKAVDKFKRQRQRQRQNEARPLQGAQGAKHMFHGVIKADSGVIGNAANVTSG